MTYWSRPGYRLAAEGRGQLRASDADRERAAEVLKTGFAEGRLSKEEYDDHLNWVYAARTNADLMAVTSQLPGGGAALYAEPRTPRTNPLAVGSLACGVAVIFFGLTAIPAVVLGHMARQQIRRTGEAGDTLAVIGLVLGWIAVTLWVIFVVLVLAAAVSFTHGNVTHVQVPQGH
jgi:hypothetical protein